MSLEKFRVSRFYRLLAWIITFDLMVSQNLFAQEFHVQEGTHQYAPVVEFAPENFPAEKGIEIPEPKPDQDASTDFLSQTLTLESQKEDHNDSGIASFEYAKELIRPEFAAAVPVQAINEKELEELRKLDVEWALVVKKGMTFLISGGRNNEIPVLEAVYKDLHDVDFIAHYQPKKMQAEDPSHIDYLGAGEKTEYQLTSDEIISFYKEGVIDRNINPAEFLQAYYQALAQSQANEAEARQWANWLVAKMDELNHEKQETPFKIRALRAAGTVAPDSTLTAANLTSFSGSPWVLLDPTSSPATSLVQQSATQFQMNYDVTASGSKSIAAVSFDNPTTAAVEVRDLSALTQFIVGASGPAGAKIRFQVEDSLGAKSEVTLIDLAASMRYYKISKTLFAGIDWTKVKRLLYSIDSTLTSVLTGTLTIQTKTLLYSATAVTTLPNTPYLNLYAGSNSGTSLVETSSTQFKLNYDVSGGSVSGATVVLDNPGTAAVETGDLSAFSSFTFGISGPADGKIKIEFEDALGAKSSAILSKLSTGTQYYTLAKNLFTGLDWTKIKQIHFIENSTLVSPLTGTITIQSKTLNFSTSLLTNLPATPRLEILAGSTAGTVLREASNASFAMDFSLPSSGSKSGAVINFGTQNLSTFSQFVFSAGGIANGKVKIEMEDTAGAKASTVLTGLAAGTQYFVLSKALFSAIDLTKVKKITFSIDTTLTSLTSGTLTIGAKTLLYSAAVAAALPGTPAPVIVEGSSAPTYLTEPANTAVRLNFDVTAAGSFSGAGFTFDDLSTAATETKDLSAGTTLTLGLQAGNTNIKKVKLQVEDGTGAKASYLIGGLTAGNQYYTLQKSLISGIDWTQIKRLSLAVDQSMIAASSAYVSWVQFTLNGFLFTRTVTACTTCTSTNVTTLPAGGALFLMPGSSNTTALSESTGAFDLSYDVTPAQSFSGARINFDKPSTAAVETGNLSSLSTLVFGVKGPANTVQVTATDSTGKKSSVLLTGITTTEQFFSISTSWFSGIDRTKILRLEFTLDPVTGNNAPDTGHLTVSVKGLGAPSFAAPGVDPVSSPTDQTKIVLKGSKGLGSGIAVNGKMVLGPTDATTWQAEVDLPLEGENILNVQETNGAGALGPATQITVIRQTIVAKTIYLLSSPYTDTAAYTLKYHLGTVQRSESVTLASGENVFDRSMTATDGSTINATFKIYLVPTLRQSESLAYDANGNLISRTDSQGKVVSYSYDVLNQLTSMAGIQANPIGFRYDKNGNRIEMTDSRGTTTYTYDNLNRLTKVTFPDSKTLSYAYDLTGNLTQLTYPDNTSVSYTYDANRRLIKVTQGTEITTYAYNTAGDLTEEVLPNGVKCTYGYDSDGRLISITHTKSDGALIQKLDYTLDADGNRTKVVESLPGNVTKTTQYTYDSLNRLQKVQYPDGKIVTYTYDAGGNRKTMLEQANASDSGILTTYFYSAENRLEKLNRANAATPAAITSEEFFYHDPRGNLVSHVFADKTVLYTYDMQNLLMKVDDGTTVTEFIYDGQGNRAAKIVNGVRTNYVVDTNGDLSQVLQELDGGGAVAKTYTLGLDRISVKTPAAGSSRFFIGDALGSTTALTNASAAVTDSYHYDAFGNLLGTVPAALPSNFLYTGEQLDPETGLVYLRARYYDPTLGRFLSKDPVLGLQTNAQTFNSYPYTVNSPVNLTDRDGRFFDMGVDRGAYSENVRNNPYDQPSVSFDSYMKVSAYGIGALATIGAAIYVAPPLFTLASEASLYASAVLRGLPYIGEAVTNPGIVGTIVGGISGHKAGSNKADELGLTGVERRLSQFSGFAFGAFNGAFGKTPGGSGAFAARALDLILGESDSHNRSKYGFLPPGGGGSGFGSSGFFGAGGNFLSSSRGGVLINKSATILGADLSQITGATFDPVTGQFVLLGTNDTTVPDIRMDDLISALKTVYGSITDPGVTIDPQYDSSGNMLDTQLVRYFGGVENSDLGWVVFEADRMMKGLTAGKDNITGEPVTSSVPGYQSLLDRWASNPGSQSRGSRFWFVPEAMELSLSSDSKSFVFTKAKIKLLTEDSFVGGGQVDPDAQAFADHFTANYDAYAAEFPIFERLRQVMKAVALARFMRDKGIPVDFSWLDDYRAPVVTTPNTTPTVRNSKTIDTGSGTLTIFIQGGVTIDGANAYLTNDTSTINSLASAIKSARPGILNQDWQVTSGGSTYNAVALSMMTQRLAGNFSNRAQDLSVPTPGELVLSLNRFYDSFEGNKSPFGFGWKADPFVAKFEKPAYVDSTFSDGSSLNGLREGDVRVLDRATGRELVFHSALVVTKTSTGSFSISGLNSNGTVNFSATGDTDGSTFTMNTDKTYLFKRLDGSSVLFDVKGRILKETDRFGKFLSYTYSGDRLTKITDSANRTIQLTYNSSGRVTRADGPLSLSVTYQYNAAGNLTSVKDLRTGLITSYTYDADHNLIGSVDPFGFTSFGNQFDIWGLASSQTDERGNAYSRTYDRAARKETVTNAVLGKNLVREYDSLQRVTKETDYLGQVTNYTYSGNNRLPASATDPKGHRINFTYDSKDHLTKVVDNSNLNSFSATLEFQYDTKGNVTWMRDSRDVVRTFTYDASSNLTQISETLSGTQSKLTKFTYDAAGNLASITDADNRVQTFTYDSLGNLIDQNDGFGNVAAHRSYDSLFRLTGLSDGLNRSTSFSYNTLDQLTQIQTVFGTVNFGYDTKGKLSVFTDALNNQTTFTYDPTTGDLLQVIDPAGKKVQYVYDAFGRLTKVTDANGEVTVFEYDALGRMTYFGAPQAGRSSSSSSAREESFSASSISELDTASNPSSATPIATAISQPYYTPLVWDAFARDPESINKRLNTKRSPKRAVKKV